ncbi:hypothetical protein PHMEG_00018314 [Phytophthora megakarya]|uniref:HAT C-terminal dimerisation domain-containing protein n=1 Tax=Phytophthora megakarya TaxID=4795 RepID=A0A225VVW6_9STRA|nr:hypothetical protein PHMEG_00018314 [Phytophthora megakarya]
MLFITGTRMTCLRQFLHVFEIVCKSVLAAFLLDPSKAVDIIEDNDLDDTTNKSVEFATRVGLPSCVSPATFRREFLGFIHLKKSWSPDERGNNLCDTPLDWWMLKSKRVPLLYDFATRVLSLPTSSAARERSWSVHSFLHNKRRNRLKPERVENLAFIYSNTGDIDSDIESPVLPERSNAAPASARNEATDLERSAAGITPRATSTLFSPWDGNHHETFSTTSNRSARETEIALTQTTFNGRLFSRADEYQLAPSASRELHPRALQPQLCQVPTG